MARRSRRLKDRDAQKNNSKLAERLKSFWTATKKFAKKYKNQILISLIVLMSIILIIISILLVTLMSVKNDAIQMKREYLPVPMSILFIGIDGGSEEFADRQALYTDSLIGVSYNPDTNNFEMLSIPRDSYMQIPCKPADEFGSIGEKVNSAYMYGTNVNGDGLGCLFETLETNLGLKFSDYLIVDFESMVKISNELGSLDIKMINGTRNFEFCEQNQFGVEDSFCFTEGQTRTMQGEELLSYVRHRKSDSTIYREKRQQQVIEGYLLKVATMYMTGGEETIKNAFLHVDTSLSYEQVKALVYQGARMPTLNKAQLWTTGIADLSMPNSMVIQQSQENLDIIYQYMINYITEGFFFSFDNIIFVTASDRRQSIASFSERDVPEEPNEDVPPPLQVTLTGTSSMNVGGVGSVAVSVSQGASYDTVSFTSSNPGVVSVNGTGGLSALAVGSATISATVTIGDETFTASLTVTVTAPAPIEPPPIEPPPVEPPPVDTPPVDTPPNDPAPANPALLPAQDAPTSFVPNSRWIS